jgi:O-antigen/teichoic acid export membrane protein
MGIIKKQAITGTFFSYLGVALGFISTGLLFPRFLTKEQIGLLNVLVAYSLIFSQFGTLGINSVTNRFFTFYRNPQKAHNGYFRFLMVVFIVGSILISALIFALKPELVANNQEKSALFVEYINWLFPLSIFTLLYLILDTYNKLLYDAVLGLLLKEFIQRVFILLFLVVFILQFYTFNSFVYGYIFAFCIPAIYLLYHLARKNAVSFKPFNRSERTSWKEIRTVAIFGIIGGMSTIAISSIDRIMVNKFEGLDGTGVYSIAFYFGTLVLIPSRALIKISTPIIADAWKNSDLKTIAEVYSKSCINQFTIAAFLFLLIWLNVDNIFQVVSPEFASGKFVIFFIGLANVIEMGTGVNQMVIATSKYFRYQTYLILFFSILVIVTNWWLIPIYGITGAAIATTMSVAIVNLTRYLFLLIKFKLQPFSTNYLKVFIIIALVLGLIHLAPSLPATIPDMLLKTTVISIVFGSLTLWWKVSSDFNEVFKSATAKLFRFTK